METTQQEISSHPREYEECISDCFSCYEQCTVCLSHCMSMGGEHVEAKHLSLMMECAQLCSTSASFMQFNSPFAIELCQVCAKVCDACASSCDEVDPEDPVMQECSAMCRQCADSCRNMVQ